MKIARFIRQPRRYKKFLFDDLSPQSRVAAQGWLSKFCQRHKHRLASKPWLYPVLIGQARRLALNPPTPEWGRSMLGKRGGKAVQKMYRWQGRTGDKHPAHKAARVSATRRKAQKARREEEDRGMISRVAPPTRVKWLKLE